jgi:hypothetical protein
MAPKIAGQAFHSPGGTYTNRFNQKRWPRRVPSARKGIIMVKLAAICGALLSCLAFAPASASAAPAQQPPWFTVSLNTVFGSGCPTGSTKVSTPPNDNTQFTVLYSQYQAATGGGTGPRHENCELTVNVGLPGGWTYGVAEVDYHGFADLDAGARGLLTADYYVSGTSPTGQSQHPVYGPTTGNYAFTDYVPVGSIVWAPCGATGTLNIDTSATVWAGSDPSYQELMTLEDTNLNLSTLYHLSFEEC